MENFFEDIFYFYSIPILSILIFVGVFIMVGRFLSRNGQEVSLGKKVLYFIPLSILVMLVSFLLLAGNSERGLVSYLGDDPVSFFKHLFGF